MIGGRSWSGRSMAFMTALLLLVGVLLPVGPAQAVTDLCRERDYRCAGGGYSGQSEGWAGRYYGAGIAFSNEFGLHNCTLYAAFRLMRNGMADPGRSFGDARYWDDNLPAGARKDHAPAVGAIAQWDSGHVAYIEEVRGDGSFVTTDDNLGDGWWDGVYYRASTSRRLFSANDANKPTWILHYRDQNPAVAVPPVAFQANTGSLWAVGNGGPGDLRLGVMVATVPAITGLRGGGWQAAFQANTGSLWLAGRETRDLGLGMAAGTSPAIAPTSTGFRVAFQANTGELWVVGDGGPGKLGLGMMAGTSPSITTLANGGWLVAFQANTGELWVVGDGGPGKLGLGMMVGTSPAIVASASGWRVAFQSNTGELWVVGDGGPGKLGLGMMAGTSPSITTLADGSWQAAFQANTGSLWVVGRDSRDLGLGMMYGASPEVIATPGGWRLAFQANTGNLWIIGDGGTGDQRLGMMKPDPIAPDTRITSGPSGATQAGEARFTFETTEAGSTFTCSWDGAAWVDCASPANRSVAEPGTHTFRVRAMDRAGNVDASPAQRIISIPTQPSVTPPAPVVVPSAPAGSSEPSGQVPAAIAGSPQVLVPGIVTGASVAFPRKKTAVVSWPAPAGATAYRVRISKKNSANKFKAWRTVSAPTVTFKGLKKKGTYRVQVTPTGSGGTGPTAAWQFKQKR